MPKIDVSKVAEILKKNQVEPNVLRRVVEEMNLAVQPDPDSAAEKEPAPKKQFVVVISDPERRLPKVDFTAWVLQMDDASSPVAVGDRIFAAAYDFNATKKGRLLPVKTVGETLENVPAKFFKERDVWVKTKSPVLVVRTDNSLPKE